MTPSLKIVPSPDSERSRIIEQVKRLPLDAMSDLLMEVATEMAMQSDPDAEISLDGVLRFARAVKASAAKPASGAIPFPNSDSAEKAGKILALGKEDVTGPERALVAAVKLFHQGTPEALARVINAENDRHKGAFIPNITTAIESATGSGFMEEITGEGHSTFRVTPLGFAQFSVLCHRLLGPKTGRRGDSSHG